MHMNAKRPDSYNTVMVVNWYYNSAEPHEKPFLHFPKGRWVLVASTKIVWMGVFSKTHLCNWRVLKHSHTPGCFHVTMSGAHLPVIEVIQSDLLMWRILANCVTWSLRGGQITVSMQDITVLTLLWSTGESNRMKLKVKRDLTASLSRAGYELVTTLSNMCT